MITIENKGHCRIIRLNRPDKFNSFTTELHQALLGALLDVPNDPSVRSVILTGAGRGFCAGQDLQESSDPNGPVQDLGDHLRDHYNPLIRAIRDLPVPVIAAVNGVAAGAGMSLALSCDLVVAAKSARFMGAFTKINLVPDSGATWTLPRLVGPMRAREIALLGTPLDAEKALSWGMITRVVEGDALIDAALDYAAQFAAMPPGGLAMTKRALEDAMDVSFDDQLASECILQSKAGKSHDHKEAVAAFMEKRPPVFKTGDGDT